MQNLRSKCPLHFSRGQHCPCSQLWAGLADAVRERIPGTVPYGQTSILTASIPRLILHTFNAPLATLCDQLGAGRQSPEPLS